MCLCVQVLRVDRSAHSSAGSAALGPVAPPSLHPVASLAALSACSFPQMPVWAGIHRISTGSPLCCSSSVICAIAFKRYVPGLPFGLAKDLMAAWLSMYMHTLLLVLPHCLSSCAVCRASNMPCSSAAYTVETCSVPIYAAWLSCVVVHTAAAPT